MLCTYAGYHMYKYFFSTPAEEGAAEPPPPPPPPPPTDTSVALPLLLVLAAIILLLPGERTASDRTFSLISRAEPRGSSLTPAAWPVGAPPPGLGWKYLATEEETSRRDSPIEASVPSWVFWTREAAEAVLEREAQLPLPSLSQLRALHAATYQVFLAQDGEDQYAMEHFFAGKHSGVILESGALDGKMFSTTWGLTEYWGWRAVHVEGFRPNFVQLLRNRPDQLNVHAALCNSTLPLHWVSNDDQLTSINGFWEMLSVEVKEKWFPTFTPERVASMPATTCRPLSPLLEVYGITHIDLWMLDIEGSEHMALSSVDWSRVVIDVISVEVLEPRTQTELDNELLVRKMIIEQGYFEHSQQGRNTWYTRHGWEPSSCSKHPERCVDAPGWVDEPFRKRMEG